MYRLTVIAGPNNAQPVRGSSFALEGNRVSIGRHSQNEIVLQSGNVSKRHCVLVVDHGKLVVQDQGSSNGTFVNGRLAAERNIDVGDRISVGEFVFEVSSTQIAVPSSSPLGFGVPAQILQFPNVSGASPVVQQAHAPAAPQDFLGKIKFHFEKIVMPYFYSFNEKYEWRFVAVSLICVFIFLNLFVSVSPLMDAHEKALNREITKRAQVMARELADRNTAALAARQESKTEIGLIEREEAVRAAVIIDLENRIIAPANKANQYFTVGPEANFAVRAKNMFLKGREQGVFGKVDSMTVAAVEPIKVLNPQQGRNEVVALAVVAIDTTLANPGAGEMSLVYSYTLVLTGMIALFIFYILYRVTLKPLEVMNERIDQTLRGEHVEMKSPVYFSEIDSLWDVIDSTLKRMPKGGDSGLGNLGGGGVSIEDLIGPLKAMATLSREGIMVLDESRKILFLNSILEEISGIRFDSSQGLPLSQASRDQAFSMFTQDLMDRTVVGTEGLIEEIEFSGVNYRVQCVAFGSLGTPQCYVLMTSRVDG
jgi:pSer/pThr/pTyr-binding forkhead associated (FHA) protein